MSARQGRQPGRAVAACRQRVVAELGLAAARRSATSAGTTASPPNLSAMRSSAALSGRPRLGAAANSASWRRLRSPAARAPRPRSGAPARRSCDAASSKLGRRPVQGLPVVGRLGQGGLAGQQAEVGQLELELHHPRLAPRPGAAAGPPAAPGRGCAAASSCASQILVEGVLGADALGGLVGDHRSRCRSPGSAPTGAARPAPGARASPGSRAAEIADGAQPQRAPAPPRSCGPRPTAARSAAGPGTPGSPPAVTSRWPSGLARSEAILATNFTSAMPAEAGSCTSLADPRAAARGRWRRPSPNSWRDAVTSRNASSSDSGSISGVTLSRMANTCLAGRGVGLERAAGPRSRAGARRVASTIGIALRTPNGRTSYEAASTTPRRRVAADDDRLAAQLGLVALLDRRVERVHVEVDDRPLADHGGLEYRSAFSAGEAARRTRWWSGCRRACGRSACSADRCRPGRVCPTPRR